MKPGTVYEPELVELMSSVLTAVWESLPVYSQQRMSKAIITERIMEAVSAGERDSMALTTAALQSNVIPMVLRNNRPRMLQVSQ